MPAILYVETNFLMSFATGRDEATNRLLREPWTFPVLLVVPSACFMEAFSAFESLKRIHERFTNDFRNHIKEVGRSIVWPDRERRLNLLEQSFLEVNDTFDRLQGRLSLGAEYLITHAETIELTTPILRFALGKRVIEDTTDNLILACILHHASANPTPTKALLSENHKDFHDNPEAGRFLREAGVKYFRDGSTCLDWLRSLGPQPEA